MPLLKNVAVIIEWLVLDRTLTIRTHCVWQTQICFISVKVHYPIIFIAYLRNLILSFCLEHLTNSIASDRDIQSIPLIATTSSPTAIDWDISAFPPGVTWNSKTRSHMLWIWNTSSETFRLQDKIMGMRFSEYTTIKSEFTQQDCTKERTASHSCMTNLAGWILACYVMIFT